VLAADLRLESPRPIAETYDTEAARRGLEVARILSMPSVVFHGEDSSLWRCARWARAIRCAAGSRSPTSPSPGAADRGHPGPGEAWADSRLLARLGVPVGASLAVGAHTVRVTQVLDYRPDQGAASATCRRP